MRELLIRSYGKCGLPYVYLHLSLIHICMPLYENAAKFFNANIIKR